MKRSPAQIFAAEQLASKQYLGYLIGRNGISYTNSHPQFASVYYYIFKKAIQVAKTLLQINLPIHILPFLLFKLNSIRKEGPIKPLLKLALNITRSVTFLTSYIMMMKIGLQIFSHKPFFENIVSESGILNQFNRAVIIGLISCSGIAFEQPHRRVDIIYYCVPRALEVYWCMLKNRKIVKGDLPFQNALCIALALAIIAYKYSEEVLVGSSPTIVKKSTKKASDDQTTTNAEAQSSKSKDEQNQTTANNNKKWYDPRSIRGFSTHVCKCFWGTHHTLKASNRGNGQGQNPSNMQKMQTINSNMLNSGGSFISAGTHV